MTEIDQLPDEDMQIGVLLALLQDDAKNQSSYLTWGEGKPQAEIAKILRRDFLVSEERADKLSGAWGRHPLLGRMYLPAYRAGTEKVAELRRTFRPSVCCRRSTAASDWWTYQRSTRCCAPKRKRRHSNRAYYSTQSARDRRRIHGGACLHKVVVRRTNGLVQMQRVVDGPHIFTKPLGGIVRRVGFRRTGSATSTPGDAVNVIAGRELQSELIEGVGRSSQACQQDQRPPSASPIQHLEADAFLHRNDSDRIRRGIGLLS